MSFKASVDQGTETHAQVCGAKVTIAATLEFTATFEAQSERCWRSFYKQKTMNKKIRIIIALTFYPIAFFQYLSLRSLKLRRPSQPLPSNMNSDQRSRLEVVASCTSSLFAQNYGTWRYP